MEDIYSKMKPANKPGCRGKYAKAVRAFMESDEQCLVYECKDTRDKERVRSGFYLVLYHDKELRKQLDLRTSGLNVYLCKL